MSNSSASKNVFGDGDVSNNYKGVKKKMKSEKKESKPKEVWQEIRAEDGTKMFLISRPGERGTYAFVAVRVKDYHPNLRYKLPGAGNAVEFKAADHREEAHNGEKYFVKPLIQ
jgi:hypothetical protein